MLKIPLAFLTVLFFCAINLKAQNISSIGVAAEFGLPSGNFASLSGIGVGASVKGNFPVSSSVAVTVNAGLMNFFGKRNPLVSVQDLLYIPLKGGLKYHLSESFYGEGQLGAGLPVHNLQNTVFIWSPGIGNQFSLSGKNKLDLGIRYEAWTGRNASRILGINSTNTKGFVGIRLAYSFAL